MADRPAYSRLQNDARREQLLARATELFGAHGYDELSMAAIAREAGISKALLYHYFPSKRELFVAALAQGAEELRQRTEPDPALPPAEQVAASVDAFLAWVDEHREGYRKLIESGGIPEVRDVVGEVRDRTADRILAGLGSDGERPPTRAAVRAWLWFMDGAVLDWLEHDDVPRDELRDVVLGALYGALLASGAQLLPASA
jgi:AcrR family transcriptional regulator